MDIQQLFKIRLFPRSFCLLADLGDLFLSQVADGLVDPVYLKPVIGAVRVAVEPIFGSGHRTAASCLVDKALRHQRHLVAKQARQSNTLNQILRSLILAAEDVEVIRDLSPADLHHVVGPVIHHPVATAFEHQLQPKQDIPAERPDGLTAHGKVLSCKGAHSPHHKRQGHANGLTRSDGSVCDNAVIILYRAVRHPPCQDLLLLA